jgi:hypothetical protein
MTISNTNNNVASLVSRIEQLEAQQEIWKKNTIWLKRCFDQLKQDFDKLAELSDVKSTQEKVLQLSAQVEDLLSRFERSLDVIVESQEAIEEVDIDDGSRQNHLVDTKLPKVEEDEEVSHGEIVSGDEFWERYEAGERDFTGINLTGADFSGANFSGVDLTAANLSQTKLQKAEFSYARLNDANLSGANLIKASLSRANLSGANLNGANLNGAYLIQANLCGAYLENTDLSNAYLSSADLRNADLTLLSGIPHSPMRWGWIATDARSSVQFLL